MVNELLVACSLLGDAIDRTDPAVLTGSDCAAVVEVLARTEKRCAGMRALLASRAVDCGAHKDRGYSHPATWLSDASGVSNGEAKAALATAGRLESCPATREALLAGELSLGQAGEIAKTEDAVPGSEADMVELAGRTGFRALKDEGRRRRLAARDPEEAYRRQRRERRLRHWRDDDGMNHLSVSWPDDVAVAVISRIEAEVDRLLRDARRDGEANGVDSGEQLAADALSNLVLGSSGTRVRRADLVLVCDINAFGRGTAEPGEVCQIIGGGPVPVSLARDLASTAFIKGVIYNGKRIESVAHFGRHLSAELRTALGLGEAPLFAGVACADCGRRYGLQWDHVDPIANHGPPATTTFSRCVGPAIRTKPGATATPASSPPADMAPTPTPAKHRQPPHSQRVGSHEKNFPSMARRPPPPMTIRHPGALRQKHSAVTAP